MNDKRIFCSKEEESRSRLLVSDGAIREMKVSVVIPTYNSSRTIRETLDSVLQQVLRPFEVIVVDDGSTDETISIVRAYEPIVSIVQISHRGVANARNVLCQRAKGNVIAFLDSDDIWHPDYLTVLDNLVRQYANASIYFIGHEDFRGYEKYRWKEKAHIFNLGGSRLIPPLEFIKSYHRAAAPFASMSYCSMHKETFESIGSQPFVPHINIAEDTYIFFLSALYGPVAYYQSPLAAYRITDGSLSSDRLAASEALIKVFELLETTYLSKADQDMIEAFRSVFSSKRRHYTKLLMKTGRKTEARRQLMLSIKTSKKISSIMKAIVLLLLTGLPGFLQPKWPSTSREIEL